MNAYAAVDEHLRTCRFRHTMWQEPYPPGDYSDRLRGPVPEAMTYGCKCGWFLWRPL